jgi:hypothetical protein
VSNSTRFLPPVALAMAAFLTPVRVEATLIGVSWDFDSPVVRIDEATGAGSVIGLSGVIALNSLAQDSTGTLSRVLLHRRAVRDRPG